MIKTMLLSTSALALLMLAVPAVQAKAPASPQAGDLARLCAQSTGDVETAIDAGGGQTLAITIHCDPSSTMLGDNGQGADENGSEANETGENGAED